MDLASGGPAASPPAAGNLLLLPLHDLTHEVGVLLVAVSELLGEFGLAGLGQLRVQRKQPQGRCHTPGQTVDAKE